MEAGVSARDRSSSTCRGRDVKYHEYGPHAILQDTVKCFWIHEGTYPSEETQDITPDGCVELIFSFGDPYVLLTTTPPTPFPAAVIVGFQNKTIPILLHGTVNVVAARLFAWGAFALLQNHVNPLTNTVTALGADWASLIDRKSTRLNSSHLGISYAVF